MAWFADLSPCTYFAEGWAHFLRSVGWLEMDGRRGPIRLPLFAFRCGTMRETEVS
jgi:hypothetical protein